MIYLRQILNKPVYDCNEKLVGKINDLAIATKEVFPRVTSIALLGPNNTPFMISARKYISEITEEGAKLNVGHDDVRFSYIQNDEVLLKRDLLDKQIVDTQGMKVVRVNDLSLSYESHILRLSGACCGTPSLIRAISKTLEKAVSAVLKLFGKSLNERLIAWNYMELLDSNFKDIKLSLSHTRLDELHPADVADILEELGPKQRQMVFERLDNVQAAEAISELEDEYQADVIEDMTSKRGAEVLNEMDADDAADIIADLPYEKAHRLLELMGVDEQYNIKSLLGYKQDSAGGVMTNDFVSLPGEITIEEALKRLKEEREEDENLVYIYTTTENGVLTGVVNLKQLVMGKNDTILDDISIKDKELITVDPDMDAEECADMISKYDLLAMPVVDERGYLLGIVTVDDAMEVLEEEHDQDIKSRSFANPIFITVTVILLVVIAILIFMLTKQ